MHQCTNVSHVVSWQLHMPKISLSMQSNTSRTAGQDFFSLMHSLSQLQCKANEHKVVAKKSLYGKLVGIQHTAHLWHKEISQVEWSFCFECLRLTVAQLAVQHASAEAMRWCKSLEKLLQSPRRACCWDFFIEVTSFLLLAHIP